MWASCCHDHPERRCDWSLRLRIADLFDLIQEEVTNQAEGGCEQAGEVPDGYQHEQDY